MALVSYNLNDVDKNEGYRCLWCLLEVSQNINKLTEAEYERETLNIYETEKQRTNALNYWRRQYGCLAEVVYLEFEIPLDFYIEKATRKI